MHRHGSCVRKAWQSRQVMQGDVSWSFASSTHMSGWREASAEQRAERGRICKGLFQNLGIALCGQRLSTKAFQIVFYFASRSCLTDHSQWDNWLMCKPVAMLNSHDLVLVANQKWERTRVFGMWFSWTETGLSWEGVCTKGDLSFIRKMLK